MVTLPLLWLRHGRRAEDAFAASAGSGFRCDARKAIGPAWLTTALGSHSDWCQRDDAVTLDLTESAAPLRRLGELSHLTSLNLGWASGRRTTEADYVGVATLRGLRTLAISDDPHCDDADLRQFAGDTGLTELDLARLPRVTPAGLAAFRGATDLSDLALVDIRISAAGLDAIDLPRKPNLIHLTLYGAHLTDDVVRRLATLPQLQSLDLTQSDLTDAGVRTLAPLVHLQKLDLFGSQVTGTGLSALRGMTQLTELGLAGCPLPATGVADWPQLPALVQLRLYSTDLDDRALDGIARLTSLQELMLTDTHVTPAGIAKLCRRLPQLRLLDCEFYHSIAAADRAALQRQFPNVGFH